MLRILRNIQFNCFEGECDMAKNIEPKLVKIGDYLKLDDDTVFIIPEVSA